MSLYFQRLLVASGVARPSSPVAAMAKPAAAAAPMLEEISEETIAPAPSLGPMPVVAPLSSATVVDAPAPRFGSEPGTVEIGPVPDVVETVAHVEVEKPFNAWSSKPVVRPSDSPAKPAPVTEPQPAAAAAPASTPGQISRAELIQHVFRWVGQNPQEMVPTILAAASTAPNEGKASFISQPAAVLPHPSAASASIGLSEVPVGRSPSPQVEPARAARPVAPTPTETSVEISIGTLQIQVEAPPAAKSARRPHLPRPTHGLPAATPPPAIDINRLRRGFYL